MALGVRVAGTGSHLPGVPVDNPTHLAHARGAVDPAWVEQLTGIVTRHLAGPQDTVASMASEAGRQALERARIGAGQLARVLLATSHGGDRPGPATACEVADRLGTGCSSFDLNNGCAGFMTGLDLGARLVATGEAPVLVIAADLLSRHLLNPADWRTWPLFGDGAAAVVLDRPRGAGALLSSVHATQGELLRRLFAPGPSDPEYTAGPWLRMVAGGREIRDIAESVLAPMAAQALAQAGITAAQLDWVAPHQPNAAWLDRLCARMGLDPGRVPRLVHRTGNIPCAMVPLGLDALWSGPQPPASGTLGLMVSVGAGMSVGAAVLRVD